VPSQRACVCSCYVWLVLPYNAKRCAEQAKPYSMSSLRPLLQPLTPGLPTQPQAQGLAAFKHGPQLLDSLSVSMGVRLFVHSVCCLGLLQHGASNAAGFGLSWLKGGGNTGEIRRGRCKVTSTQWQTATAQISANSRSDHMCLVA
jgi:hypothetical protein